MKTKSADHAHFMLQKAFIAGHCDMKLFGLTTTERLRRQLKRLQIDIVATPNDANIILSAQHIYGASVLEALKTAKPGLILVDQDHQPAAVRVDPQDTSFSYKALFENQLDALKNHPKTRTGAELAGRYDQNLRKRTDPTVMRVVSRALAEKVLFNASYKGVTDFVTKHVWPKPALVITRLCAKFGYSPNHVTSLSAVFVVLTFWLFWHGFFVTGLMAAWIMTLLDTVDGKLARVTLTSSKFGDKFDHGIDLIHPPFWWWAFAVGCAANGTPLNDGGLVLGAILFGYVLQRVEEGIFILRFKIQMHIWRAFDSFFRQITARRNPNLFILTLAVLAGYPREGLIFVAIWTILCLIVHSLQIIQGSIAARHGPLKSWLAQG